MTRYKCPYCSQEFDNFYTFSAHMMTAHKSDIDRETTISNNNNNVVDVENNNNNNDNNNNIDSISNIDNNNNNDVPKITVILGDGTEIKGPDWYYILDEFAKYCGYDNVDLDMFKRTFWNGLKEQGLVSGRCPKKISEFFKKLKDIEIVKDILVV